MTAEPWWGCRGAKPLEALRILYFTLPKIVKKTTLFVHSVQSQRKKSESFRQAISFSLKSDETGSFGGGDSIYLHFYFYNLKWM